MDMNQMRALVRRDLHDEDASAYRWTDPVLDRHIQHAVREGSIGSPLQAIASLTTGAGSRDLSLSGISDLLRVEAAEYPMDKYPPVYVRFSVWADALTLLLDAVPSGEETVRLYYTKMHLLDETTSTLPPSLTELVVMGAGAYAALEWAGFATNRVNVGGADTWRHYLTWGKERLRLFHSSLARVAVNSSVRSRRLYTPAEPPGPARLRT